MRGALPLRNFSKLLDYAVQTPTISSNSVKRENSWERLAHKIKGIQTDREKALGIKTDANAPDKQYVKSLQREFSVEDSLGKLEDELQEEMAYALGKTGEKVMQTFRHLKETQCLFHSCCDPSNGLPLRDKRDAVAAYNEAITAADDARRELIIHRQACGFTYNNHTIISEAFPIPSKKRVLTWSQAADLAEMSSYKRSQMKKIDIKEILGQKMFVTVDGNGTSIDKLSKDELLSLLVHEVRGN